MMFGQRLKEIRKRHDLSQGDLAIRARVHQSALSTTEKHNRSLPGTCSLEQLLGAMNLTPAERAELTTLYQAQHGTENVPSGQEMSQEQADGTRNVPSRQRRYREPVPIPEPAPPEEDPPRRVRAKPGVLEERQRVLSQRKPPLEFPLTDQAGTRLGTAWIDDVDVAQSKLGGIVGIQYRLEGDDSTHVQLACVDPGRKVRDLRAVVLLLIPATVEEP